MNCRTSSENHKYRTPEVLTGENNESRNDDDNQPVLERGDTRPSDAQLLRNQQQDKALQTGKAQEEEIKDA